MRVWLGAEELEGRDGLTPEQEYDYQRTRIAHVRQYGAYAAPERDPTKPVDLSAMPPVF